MERDVQKLIKDEAERQERVINLIASENYVSPQVREALGSVFTNKYAEGYPGARYYGGNEVFDEIEVLAQERALKLFGLDQDVWHANVQPYSGSPANMAVYSALISHGEKFMGLRLDMGGHLTHGQSVSITGKFWQQVAYTLNKETELLDYDEIGSLAREEHPRLIVAGYTAYSRIIDFAAFRRIADDVGAYLMIDMSHFAGLVAGGVYPSPFPYADVVMTTTHKTLRGPRAAIIFCKKELSSRIDKAVFPGLQGGPHGNQIAAVAVALREAMQPEFKEYAARVVRNASTLSNTLKEFGWRIISGGTDTHVFLVDTWADGKGIAGKEAGIKLEEVDIIVNKNTIPYDTRKPFDPSGIRIGTPAITTRGMGEREMIHIAGWIDRLLKNGNPKEIHEEVRALTQKFPLP